MIAHAYDEDSHELIAVIKPIGIGIEDHILQKHPRPFTRCQSFLDRREKGTVQPFNQAPDLRKGTLPFGPPLGNQRQEGKYVHGG